MEPPRGALASRRIDEQGEALAKRLSSAAARVFSLGLPSPERVERVDCASCCKQPHAISDGSMPPKHANQKQFKVKCGAMGRTVKLRWLK